MTLELDKGSILFHASKVMQEAPRGPLHVQVWMTEPPDCEINDFAFGSAPNVVRLHRDPTDRSVWRSADPRDTVEVMKAVQGDTSQYADWLYTPAP